ncbi:MAG: polyamine aminopropyltransferase [Cyanobacteria bacterium HKST-UBA06]|nr:polyamine aminopropyltransferase [Cyanobacteria bacterium HKST-UBA06]
MTTQGWVSETVEGSYRLSFPLAARLFEGRSDFQKVEVVATPTWGRMLLLDGLVQTTERDEWVYHEMIAHVPLLAHRDPKRVLVIGGGDGGTVREVLKHPGVQEVVLCEIDAMVIEACKQHLPGIACALVEGDRRLTVRVGDGVAYVADEARGFDVVIVDSSEPMGPGEELFSETFYTNVAQKALNAGGLLVAQTESPWYNRDVIERVYPMLGRCFAQAQPYLGFVPTYPSGCWTWAFCAKTPQPVLPEANQGRAAAITPLCRYYNPDLHRAAFVMPNFVVQQVEQPSVVSG